MRSAHLSAGEDEDQRGSSCSETPGEQGPQKGLNHRTEAWKHDACAEEKQKGDTQDAVYSSHRWVWTKSCLSRIPADSDA